MLRTNLATRPFYNERLVHLVLVAAAVLIAALTVFNVYELRVLSGRYSQLVRRVGQAEDRAVRLRSDADRARRSIDRKQLEVVAEAAREANGLIDQRTFSWTELLNRLETTLPPEVKIQSIKPSTDREGNLTVTMVVVSRRAEDVEAFVERLEGTGTFHRLFSKTETTNQQGLLEVLLEGQYLPASGQPETGPAGGPAGARED